MFSTIPKANFSILVAFLSSACALNLDLCKILSFSNFLPNDKILTLSKFKAFADDKIVVTYKLNFVLGE